MFRSVVHGAEEPGCWWGCTRLRMAVVHATMINAFAYPVTQPTVDFTGFFHEDFRPIFECGDGPIERVEITQLRAFQARSKARSSNPGGLCESRWVRGYDASHQNELVSHDNSGLQEASREWTKIELRVRVHLNETETLDPFTVHVFRLGKLQLQGGVRDVSHERVRVIIDNLASVMFRRWS